MVDWKVLAWNIASSVSERVFDIVENRIVEQIVMPAYEKVEELDKAVIEEPARETLKYFMATALEPYSGKVVEVGHSQCPFCKAIYEEITPKIFEGKADAIWVDRDPLASQLFLDFGWEEVPQVVKVKKKGDKVLVKDVKTKKVKVYKDLI